jgi:pimeloyl-ACP methyl ester carboxylesterase
MSVVAGCGFGLFYIGMGQASEHAGMWPLAGARVASLTLVGLACVVTRRSIRLAPGTTGTVALAGTLDLSTPLEWAQRAAARAPGGKLVVVENAGHGVQGQKDPEMLATLRAFVAAQAG